MNDQNIISKYVPNFITLLSLSSGFTSIRFSLKGDWEIAIYLVLLATIFDFFDGWFARKLKSGSNFGAELDSLSDFVSFGVAPSILVYLWSTNVLGSLGWGATLFFAICSALRLARFTADIYITNKPIDKNEYFTYDKVVLATHADQALAIIEDPYEIEKKILSNFKYKTNEAVIHEDINYMPKNNKAWCSWNSSVESEIPEDTAEPETDEANEARLINFSKKPLAG